MNPTDPYETGFPKKGTYEKIPYHDSVGDLGFRHLSLGFKASEMAIGPPLATPSLSASVARARTSLEGCFTSEVMVTRSAIMLRV
jgi:hypothetical protein